ncbi:MAG TPA: sulfite exporter TauE/SafE family protein [Methylophilus sp.]|nr:sulfite exporter TauE/SafE family protein [Methylophilus sp.]HQQ33241.1 sulfite exporter TauE/SafE family protein [Methylophilus sp.]
MQLSLAITTFLMGLAGGPHCIAMCGAVCGGLQQGPDGILNISRFHAGRMLGYAVMGAIAAASVKSLAWLSEKSLALHPLWTFFHILIFFWGLMLVFYARQPAWANQLGQNIWSKIRKLSNLPGGTFTTGVLWGLLPCGLLYSALLVSSVSANIYSGALNMLTFAIGTSISLLIGPWLWLKLKNGSNFLNDALSMRLAGLMLCMIAGWAIWMDLFHKTKIWCVY